MYWGLRAEVVSKGEVDLLDVSYIIDNIKLHGDIT